MTEESAVRLFEIIIAQRGPQPADYSAIVTALDDLHGKEFAIEHGLSTRVATHKQFEGLLARHPEIFRSPTTMQGFAQSKPHGYAGDFEMIEKIYSRTISADPRLKNWDEFFHAGTAPQAVCNRGKMLASLLANHQPRSLLSVGSGPGIDLLLASNEGNLPQIVHLLDNDLKALNRSRIHLAPIEDKTKIEFHHRNALRFRSETKYDLIWSSGLFDYLNDKTASFLIRRLFSMLSEKGTLVIGNFGLRNPSRAYMELIGQWFLIHRDDDDLLRLAEASGVSAAEAVVSSDSTEVNLFLNLSRTQHAMPQEGVTKNLIQQFQES